MTARQKADTMAWGVAWSIIDGFRGGTVIMLEGVEALFWLVCREFWVLKPVDDQELCCDGNPNTLPAADAVASYTTLADGNI